MKQYITEQQWREITDQQHVTFLKAIGKQTDEHITGIGFILPLPSIGEMIQFLDEHITDEWWQIQRDGGKSEWRIESKYNFYEDLRTYQDKDRVELIDTLWNVAKAILEDAR
jgi:hypothetical protein